MRLADDRRGRVPFALLGVLLLVGASAYAADLERLGPTPVDREAASLVDGVERDLRPALRVAVRRAATDAARQPVTEPADTAAGRALGEGSPFTDALRLRIALAVADQLEDVRRRRGHVVAAAALPSPGNGADTRAAIRNVTVQPVDGGAALQVTIRGIRLVAMRDGRVHLAREVAPTLTVHTPVLAVHRRVERYERRLNRGPLEGAGLGRRLTARLYPVAWARGYGQYDGALIADVLGNRHVELSTNAALLAEQRAVFGRADPAARRALSVGTARVGLTDLVGPSLPRGEAWARLVLRPNAADRGASAGWAAPRVERDPLQVDAATAADTAYVATVERGGLNRITRRVYRVEARLETNVEPLRVGSPPSPVAPGRNWTLLRESTDEWAVVLGETETTRAAGDLPESSGRFGGRVFGRTVPTVVVHHEVTRRWIHPDGRVRTTHGRWRDRYRVTIAVTGGHAPKDRAPDRRTRPVFRRGGAVDGPNLRDVPRKAWSRLLAENDGVGTIAVRAVREEPLVRRVTLEGRRPATLEGWILADLAALHGRVRQVSVEVDSGRVAAGRANPARALATELRQRRPALIDAQATYDGVADRARVAARAAYLDGVLRRLDERATRTRERNRAYLETVGEGTAGRLSGLVAIGEAGPGDSGAVRQDTFVPDGSPPYLTLAAVDHEVVPTVPPGERSHPLVARTVNTFALPHGDAAELVGESLAGGERVRLRTAAQALLAADRALASRSDARLEARRTTLRRAVGASLDRVTDRARQTVVEETTLDRQHADRVVSDALAHWRGPGRQALAATNGSLAGAVAAEARENGVSNRTARTLAIHLRVEFRRLRADGRVRVPAAATNETATATRRVARTATTELVSAGLDRGAKRALERWAGVRARVLPSGLPVAPVPGYWYATVNAWSVAVRGEYRAFAVRARVGPPDGAGAVLTYVRDGSAVRLDVDGDGSRELLGYAGRVGFAVTTTVVVAVPPGPPGVGDADGDRVEESPGWPCPGTDGRERCPGFGSKDGGTSGQTDGQPGPNPPAIVDEASEEAAARARSGNRFPAGSPTG